jgi:hypothetical protein
MNQIIISNYGNGIAVGLEGDKDFIEMQINRFFNFGAISKNGEFHFQSENFGYFVSSEDSMISALAAQKFMRFLIDGTSKLFKKNPKAMNDATMSDARKEYESFKFENFMSYQVSESNKSFGTASNGRAEVWEEDYKASK